NPYLEDEDSQVPSESQQPTTSSDLQSSTHTSTPLNLHPPLSSQPSVNNPSTLKFTESLLGPLSPYSPPQINPVSTITYPRYVRTIPDAVARKNQQSCKINHKGISKIVTQNKLKLKNRSEK
ncbi:hypothetical protein J6590_086802, partial [Homalodisca vitripennis]